MLFSRRHDQSRGTAAKNKRVSEGTSDKGSDDLNSPDVTPASAVAGLNDEEFEILCQVGKHWGEAIGGNRALLRALPVDPSLHHFPEAIAHPVGRFAAINFVDEGSTSVAATAHAGSAPSVAGVLGRVLRRILFGAPLANTAVASERMRKLIALPILSSDALSSVAYGPEAMLVILALAGSKAIGLSIYIAIAIAVLMIAVGFSYRQIIRAYPHGGGSYVVAGENLGQFVGLVAAGGLLIDYILTVAVSIASGVAAITSAISSLESHVVIIGLIVIALLLVGNLRGVREAGALFSAPTYLFIAAMFLLIIVGLTNAASRGFSIPPVKGLHAVEGLTVLLVLRAFSSGATAMTGIEAISNSVPAFKPSAWRNARASLTIMVSLLVSMFIGLIVLMYVDATVPKPNQTVLSQLAHGAFGSGFFYWFIQLATALVLLLAANTAFNGFPRLLSMMARNGHAPRFFLRLGDRLTFSNGILLLASAAALIFVAFSGSTNSLIPLYAVGVFLAFTLGQTGMVIHWWRKRESNWQRSLIFNALGALLSGIVFVIAAVTKFTAGAWVALVLVLLIVIACWRIRIHYVCVREFLRLKPLPEKVRYRFLPEGFVHRPAGPSDRRGDEEPEEIESPEQIHHLAVVPVARLDLSSLRALAYAASLGQPVLAVHLSLGESEAKRFSAYWRDWGDHLPLEIVNSPYRAVVGPMARYIVALKSQQPGLTITVVLPELIVKHWWHQVLHNGTTRRLRRALRKQHGLIITTVPLHLPS